MTASLACLNSAKSALSVTVGNASGHGRLEEPAIAVHLLDGDLGVNLRRVLQVRPRVRKRRGHRLLARDQLPQAIFGRRKVALDHDVGRAREAAAVRIGIDGPTAARLRATTAARRSRAAAARDRAASPAAATPRRSRGHTPAELLRRGDGVIDGLARVVVEPIVVFVDAEIGRPCRLAVDRHLRGTARETSSNAALPDGTLAGGGCGVDDAHDVAHRIATSKVMRRRWLMFICVLNRYYLGMIRIVISRHQRTYKPSNVLGDPGVS